VTLAVAGEVGNLVDRAPEKWNEWASDPVLQARAARWRADLSERFPFVERLDGERLKASLTVLGEAIVKRSVGS